MSNQSWPYQLLGVVCPYPANDAVGLDMLSKLSRFNNQIGWSHDWWNCEAVSNHTPATRQLKRMCPNFCRVFVYPQLFDSVWLFE